MRKFFWLIFVMLIIAPVASFAGGYDDFYVTLNNGLKMPMLGLGTWTLNDNEAENCVYIAIKNGYRLIDTARYYRNEKGVGNGVRRAISEGIIKREDIFITSKILPGYNPDSEINNSVNSLGLDYVDLMLIHQPGYNDEETYKVLERSIKSGKVKSIGISNYYTKNDFQRITRNAEIMPVIIQNENHPLFQNLELQNYVKQFGIFIESWYPFGGRGNTQKIFNNEIIKSIANSHNKTPAQIILRWQIQAGFIVIPGSKNPEHIKENINIFDFELSEQEMQKMKSINQNIRFENW